MNIAYYLSCHITFLPFEFSEIFDESIFEKSHKGEKTKKINKTKKMLF